MKPAAQIGELLRLEAELDELMARGFGEKHPRMLALRDRTDGLRAALAGFAGPPRREAEEAAAKAEVQRLEAELDALLVEEGLGAQHPRVEATRKRLAHLQTSRASLRSIREREAETADQRARLAQLEDRLRQLLTRHEETAPAVRELRAAIEELRSELETAGKGSEDQG